MQEEDRRRIARELHSNTAQRLAALQLNLSLVARSADALEPRARAALSDSVDLVRVCAREIRSVSYHLHPPLLDEFGLSAALRAYAEEFTQRTGIGIEVNLPRVLARMPNDIEIGIFRIVQDSVETFPPESPAKLNLERDAVCITMALVYACPMGSRDPVAVAAIHERAQQLNGRLIIRCGRGSLTLRLKIPLRVRGVRGASA